MISWSDVARCQWTGAPIIMDYLSLCGRCQYFSVIHSVHGTYRPRTSTKNSEKDVSPSVTDGPLDIDSNTSTLRIRSQVLTDSRYMVSDVLHLRGVLHLLDHVEFREILLRPYAPSCTFHDAGCWNVDDRRP
jgi:hypothetical protein